MSDEGEDPSPRPKRKVKKVMVLSSAASSDSDDSGPTTSTRKKRLRVLSEEDSDSSSGSWAMGVVRRRRALPGLRDSDGDSDSSEWATDQSDGPQTTVPSASPPASNSPSVNATKASGFSSDSSEGNSEKCSICLMKFLNQEVGTPQNCEHIFCLDCITEWSKNMNTCPVDRISFDSIVVRAVAGGRVLRTEQVVVAERRPSLEMMIIEDPTVCEVCHNADREESMLLCDGCDLGFHMHCLTPPLTRIPEDQWLCPNCNGVWRSSPIFFPMQSSHSFNTFDTYERPSRATRGDDEPSTSSGRGRGAASRDAPSSSRSSRALGGGASGSARRATAPRTTTPRTRKRTYKRRKTRTVIVEYEVEGEGKFPITKTRRVKTRVKKRKIKKRQPRTAARRTHVRASVRAKLATLRGAPPVPARAPAELAVRRAGAGIPALSLFGSAHQLDYFEEEEQDSGGAGAARASRPTSAVLSAYRQARRKMLSIPSPSRASAAPDLLSDILASQARLHCKHSVLSVTVAGDVNITIQTHKPDNKPKPDKREDTPLADKKGVDLTKGEGTRQAPLYPGQGRGWGGGYRYPRDTQSHDQGNQGYGRGGYGNGYGGAQRGPGGPGGHGGPGGPGAYQDRRDDNNGHFNDYHNRRPHQYSNDDEPWPDRNRRHQPDQNRGPNNNLGDERRYSGGPGWRPQRRPDGPPHRQSFGGFENPLDMRMGHEPPHTGPGVSRSHSFPEDSWDKPQPYRPHLQPPTSELDNSQPSNLEFDNSEPPTLEFDNSQPPNLEFGNYQPTTLEFDSSEPPTLDFDNSQPPNVEFDNSQPPTFEFDNSITPGIERDKSEDEKSDEGLIIDTEKYDPTEPTHDDDSWGDDSAVPASQVPACSSATPTPPALSPGRLPALSPGRLPSPPAPPILPLGCLRSPPTPPELPPGRLRSPPAPPCLPPLPLPPPPLPPDTPSVETILAGIDTRAIDVPADVLDSAVRQVLQEHRALMAPGDRGDCPNFSIYSATSVHIATDSSRLVPDKPLLRRNSLEDLVQEDGELTPPEPFAPLDLVDDVPTVSPTKATYGLVQQSAEEYKAKVSKRCPITINTRNPIKIKLNTPSLIKRQVSLYDDEDISQELDKNAEPTAEPHQQTTTEAVSATDESKEEKDPSESEAERGISTEEKNDPIDDKEADDGTSTPHISDEDATPKRLDKDLDDDRTDDELDTDDVSSHSGRSARAAKMTESISETEDERSYTPCLDENKSKDASLEDKGIEGLDTEMISEEEGNDMFSEGSAAAAGAGTPLPEEGEILDKRPKNDDTKKKKKKESKKEKEGKSKGRKRSDVAFKKIGKGKERNYREREKEKEKRRSPASSRERRRRKDKRKDLERYDVRTLVTERRRRPKDAFGRDVSPSGSRSPSPADPPPRLGSTSPSARRALSPSPRRARLSPSPRRARSSLSPRRGRLSPSPRRGRLSPSPRRGRLSPSPRRGRFSPSPLRRRASVSPIRPRLSPSPRRARISPSPRRRLSPSPRRARLASLSPRRRPASAASPRRSPSPKRRRKRSGSRPKPARRPRSASRRKRRRSASPALTPKPTKAKKKKRARSPRRRSPRRKRVRRRSASPPAPPLAAAAWSPPPLSPRTPPPAEPIPLEERRRRREVERAHRRMREAAGPSKEVFTSGDNILVSVSFKEQERAEGIGRRERRKERRRRRRRVAGEPEAGPKPIAIIDLERSPFRELTPSPKNIIVLSDDEAPAAAAAPEPAPAAAQGPKTPPDPAEPAPAPAPAAAPSLEEGRGPLTPPEPPDSPDAYDPFEPTRSASNSPGAAAGPPPAADDAERPSMTLEAAQKTNLSADEVLDRRPLSPIEKVMALLQSTRDVSPEEPAQREAGASPGGGLADAPGPTAAVAPAPRAALSEQPRPPLKLFLAKPSPIKSDPIKPMPQATKISRLPLPCVRRRSESDGGGASPYSPGSSDFGDLFEPPHQPVRPRKGRNGRFGKRAKRGKKTVNVRLDDDSLQIVDELPSSAVEMQLKSKFLKKLNRQERVVEEVKLLLKPHYNKKHVSKDEYKHILRRAVPKICHNKTGEINPTKIQALVEAYVKKFRKKRKLGQ